EQCNESTLRRVAGFALLAAPIRKNSLPCLRPARSRSRRLYLSIREVLEAPGLAGCSASGRCSVARAFRRSSTQGRLFPTRFRGECPLRTGESGPPPPAGVLAVAQGAFTPASQ